MPVIDAADGTVHEMHGTRFVSYAAPSRGSAELCVWRVEIPGRTAGVPHAVTREEVLCVVSGTARVSLGEQTRNAVPGDVIVVQPGQMFSLDTSESSFIAWVVTSVGLEARFADGSTVRPPWTV